MAIMSSSESIGETMPEVMDSPLGVWGTEEVGVGLEGMLVGGAMGSVNDRRLELRECSELDLLGRVSNVVLVADKGAFELDHGCKTNSACLSSCAFSG